MSTGSETPDDSAPLSEDELREIYATYGDLMHRRCLVLLRDRASADDAFQDSFVSLIRYGANFRGAQSKLAWLYRVCHHAAFRHYGKQRKIGIPESSLKVKPDVPVHASSRYEDWDAVLRIFARLGDKEREVAVLTFVDGLNQGQVAERVGWSRQTVNKKLQAIRDLAAELLRGK